MVKRLLLVGGEKRCLNNPVVQWRLFSDENPAVVAMIASVQAEPRSTTAAPFSGHGAENAVLAFEMTPQVAMQLHDQLGELGRRQGWLAQKTVERA
jgi:hypothetical protein